MKRGGYNKRAPVYSKTLLFRVGSFMPPALNHDIIIIYNIVAMEWLSVIEDILK